MAEDLQRRRARDRQYYLRNREQKIAWQKEYRKQNLAARKQYDRQRYRANRERLRAEARARYAANKEAQLAHNERRRARLLNSPRVEKIDRQYIIARDRSTCHICGKRVRDRIELDHLIPLSRGGTHTHDNLAVAHRECNRRRHAGYLPAQLLLIG